MEVFILNEANYTLLEDSKLKDVYEEVLNGGFPYATCELAMQAVRATVTEYIKEANLTVPDDGLTIRTDPDSFQIKWQHKPADVNCEEWGTYVEIPNGDTIGFNIRCVKVAGVTDIPVFDMKAIIEKEG